MHDISECPLSSETRESQKASVCSVAIVSPWLCVPPVGGNSRLVAVIATDFFGVNIATAYI